jgi:recombination protein RecA
LDIGADLGILRKSGAFYSLGETRLGQGREAARQFLKQNKDIAADVDRQIRAVAIIGGKTAPTPAPPATETSDG